MTHTEAWSLAFLLTVAVEVPLVVALTQGSPRGMQARAAFAFVAQLMTHPLVWFVFPEMTWGRGMRSSSYPSFSPGSQSRRSMR
jgi:hypothetical protein